MYHIVSHQDTTPHLLEWPKSRTLTTPNAIQDVSHRHSHLLMVEIQNGTEALEDSLQFLTKLNTLFP